MGRYFLALFFLLVALPAYAACPAKPDVSGVVNVMMCGAKGDAVSDNSTAFTDAKTLAGGTGTIFIPKGTYTWSTATALAFTKANCNVTIRGDSQGGTVIKPTFSNSDAISFIDSATESPPDCRGGVRDITIAVGDSVPTNLNLIHVSNILGLTFEHIYTLGFNGAGDSTIYLDPGTSTATFTERITMIDIRSMLVTNMLTLDGKHLLASLNNNEMLASHCDPSGTGSCINMINMAGDVLLGSYFEFNADLNTVGQSVIFTDHRADDLNGDAEFHVRSQSTIGGTTYCFNAPAATGNLSILGAVFCAGAGVINEKNGNVVSGPGAANGLNLPLVTPGCDVVPSMNGDPSEAAQLHDSTGAPFWVPAWQ